MNLCEAEVPKDYSSPKWDETTRVHDWRNYIINPLRDIWGTFTEVQKMVIAQNAEQLANQEEWD